MKDYFLGKCNNIIEDNKVLLLKCNSCGRYLAKVNVYNTFNSCIYDTNITFKCNECINKDIMKTYDSILETLNKEYRDEIIQAKDHNDVKHARGIMRSIDIIKDMKGNIE